MVPRNFISPFLFSLLLVSSSIDVSTASFSSKFRKFRLGSSSQDAKGQSGISASPPPLKQPQTFPLRKKPQPPIQPITIARRLELWYRPGDNLLAAEIKGQLGGTEAPPPYMVEGPPGEECDPKINTPNTLNTVDAKRMKQSDLRQYNARLIQEELVNARHVMYDDRGKYKSGNPYVTGIQKVLDSMIHVLDSDRNPDGDVRYKRVAERYKDVAKYRGYLPEGDEWRSYPLSSFTFEWGNEKTIEVLDSRSCGRKDKCHEQKIGFSGEGRVGLSPPVVYRVCACAVLNG